MAGEIMLAALRHVWGVLLSLRVPVALVGGLAMATWKYPRSTRDIDLLLAISEEERSRLLETLEKADIRSKHSSAGIRLGDLNLLQFLYEPPKSLVDIEIDLLLGQSEYHRHALARRIPVYLAGLDLEVAVLTCEDIILHKLLAGRLIDRADVVALVRANRNTLDYPYLEHWTKILELTDAWSALVQQGDYS